MTEWEAIVVLALEVDRSLATRGVADPARVFLLARKVQAFSERLPTLSKACEPKPPPVLRATG